MLVKVQWWVFFGIIKKSCPDLLVLLLRVALPDHVQARPLHVLQPPAQDVPPAVPPGGPVGQAAGTLDLRIVADGHRLAQLLQVLTRSQLLS